MGLLDFSLDDPKGQLLATLGMGLLQSKGGFGQALGQAGTQALGAYNQAKISQQQAQQRKQQEAMQQVQMQMLMQQLTDSQRQQQRQAGIEGAYRGAIRTPEQVAMAGNGGPTNAAAAAAPNARPQFDQSALIRGLMQVDPVSAAQMLQPKPADYKVVGDSLVQIGGDGVREAYRAPQKPDFNSLVIPGPDGKPMLNQMVLDAKRMIAKAGASSTSVSYGTPMAGVDANGRPVFFQPSKDGGAPAIVPGVAPPKNEKPMTEAQAKAATFMSQMQAAEKELSGIPIDMTKPVNQLDVGLAGGWTNVAASPAAQRARQSQEQWAESFLRFKTGAAATADEVKLNVRTFFPQPGDSKAVIEQKQRMRKQAIQDIGMAASGNPPDHSAGKPKADGAASIDDLVNKWAR